jgi:hypothetical protein
VPCPTVLPRLPDGPSLPSVFVGCRKGDECSQAVARAISHCACFVREQQPTWYPEDLQSALKRLRKCWIVWVGLGWSRGINSSLNQRVSGSSPERPTKETHPLQSRPDGESRHARDLTDALISRLVSQPPLCADSSGPRGCIEVARGRRGSLTMRSAGCFRGA